MSILLGSEDRRNRLCVFERIGTSQKRLRLEERLPRHKITRYEKSLFKHSNIFCWKKRFFLNEKLNIAIYLLHTLRLLFCLLIISFLQ